MWYALDWFLKKGDTAMGDRCRVRLVTNECKILFEEYIRNTYQYDDAARSVTAKRYDDDKPVRLFASINVSVVIEEDV